MIVFLLEFARQQSHESSTSTYLFTYLLGNSLSNCTSILLITIRERFWNTRVCKPNRRVLFNFVRNSFSIRSSTFHLLYLLGNLFQNLFEHLHYSSKYLTKTYAFANQIDAFSSFSFRKFRNLVSLAMDFSTKSFSKTTLNRPIMTLSTSKFLSTYEKRLVTLANWNWRNSFDSSKETMVVADFSKSDHKLRAKCTYCSLVIFGLSKILFEEHLQNSSECSLVLQLEKTKLEISKDIKQVELINLEVKKRVESKVLKVAKLTSVAADIEYFDSTLLCDIQKFDLHHETIIFCQHLQNVRVNYREVDLIQLLHICLRDFAFVWYQEQSETVKQNLNEWLKVLITAFSAKSFAKFSIQTFFALSVIFSSQYHFCLNCSAFFSSLIRLLQHIQKIICQKTICKQCEKIFESKNKLHEHIRQHHVKSAKKMIKNVSKRNFNKEKDRNNIFITTTTTTSSISSKTTSKFSIFRSVTLSKQTRNSFISFVISASIASTASSKRSRFSISTSKSTSKRAKTASIECSLISFATSSSRLRKSISKSYFTIHNLHRMFAEKSKSFDLQQHQIRRSFSQKSDSRPFIIYQSRIIAYFLSAINEKTSINQNLKNSNSKSFQQSMFAKTIRSDLLKKSIISSYKNSDIFYISLQSRFSFLQSKFSSRFSFWFSFTFSPFFEFSLSNLHVCCICFDRFNFRNDLFDYRRFNQRYFLNRRPIEKIWKK